ncbi:MAG: hypothetical protein FJ126_00735 [Deltaproteobacteria bacterium]|nr:hypothetical protein [Deltaproteobacteria bacterium]
MVRPASASVIIWGDGGPAQPGATAHRHQRNRLITLYPCSNEISEARAHNQRGEVRVQVRFKIFFWIKDQIRLVEQSDPSEV